MANTVVQPAPRGGGSAEGCITYLALEESQRKEVKAQARDNKASIEQIVGLEKLYEYTDSLPSRGVGEIIKPNTPNARVSAMYCEGVTAFSLAAMQIDATSNVQSRLAAPIDHVVQTYTTERSKTITDEQAIEAKIRTIKKVYGEKGHAFFSFVHRDTLVWDSAEGFVMGQLVDGKVLDATRIEASFENGVFKRVMVPDGHGKEKPKPGVRLGHDVVAGELVDGNVHVHSAISVICTDADSPGKFLKARKTDHFFMRWSRATKEMEIEMGLVDKDPGLYRVATGPEGLQRVEVTGHKEWAALHREKSDQRLSEQATHALNYEFDTPQTITERLQVELRETLNKIDERDEKRLWTNVHATAAKFYVKPEREDGKLVWRLMRKPEKGRGDGEWVDSEGNRHVRTMRWVETDTFLDVDPKMVAPSPADSKSQLTKREMEQHVKALDRRKWLEGLGTAEDAESEYKETLRADPGRVARDLIAAGNANFFAGTIATELKRHITDHDWGFAWLDFVLNNDKDLVILSAITPSPLYTTKAQKAMTEEFVHGFDARMSALDPTYDPELLERTILRTEAQIDADRRRRAPNVEHKPFKYTDVQRKTFHEIASHKETVIQGDAGVGKTVSWKLLKNYYDELHRKVLGFSTGSKAAEGLALAAGFDAKNFAMAKALQTHKGVEMVTHRSVVVLEEASTLSVGNANLATNLCAEKDATLVLIGDGAQQRSLEAGNVMGLAMHVANKHKRLIKWTEVFRMSGERVRWLASDMPKRGQRPKDHGWTAYGGWAIRTENAAEFEHYVREYDRRGHFKYFAASTDEATGEYRSAKKNMMLAIAEDVARVTKVGEKPIVILPARARNDCRIINDAVCTALGFDGTGQKFTFMEGEREIAVGMRVSFKRNAVQSPFRKEADQEIHMIHKAPGTSQGVLNGYTGTVTGLEQVGKRWRISVDLDNGSKIWFDPGLKGETKPPVATYRDVDRGYSATKMVYQGADSPIDLTPVTAGDDPNSFHVGATRVSEIDLGLYTTMPNIDAVCKSLVDKLGQDSDAVLYQRIVQEHGGEHTPWAKQVRKMIEDDNDPLTQQWAAIQAATIERSNVEIAEIMRAEPKRTQAREKKIRAVLAANKVESKTVWAWKNFQPVEDQWNLMEALARERDKSEKQFWAEMNVADPAEHVGHVAVLDDLNEHQLRDLNRFWNEAYFEVFGEATLMTAQQAAEMQHEVFDMLIARALWRISPVGEQWHDLYRYHTGGLEAPCGVEKAHELTASWERAILDEARASVGLGPEQREPKPKVREQSQSLHL